MIASAKRNAVASPARKPAGEPVPGELAQVFDSVAQYFALLAEPTRLRIMHSICEEERSVSAIVTATGATQTNVSRHLALLLQAGVVHRRREGNAAYYRVADEQFVALCRTVCLRIASRIDDQKPLRRELLQFAAGR